MSGKNRKRKAYRRRIKNQAAPTEAEPRRGYGGRWYIDREINGEMTTMDMQTASYIQANGQAELKAIVAAGGMPAVKHINEDVKSVNCWRPDHLEAVDCPDRAQDIALLDAINAKDIKRDKQLELISKFHETQPSLRMFCECGVLLGDDAPECKGHANNREIALELDSLRVQDPTLLIEGLSSALTGQTEGQVTISGNVKTVVERAHIIIGEALREAGFRADPDIELRRRIDAAYETAKANAARWTL